MALKKIRFECNQNECCGGCVVITKTYVNSEVPSPIYPFPDEFTTPFWYRTESEDKDASHTGS